MQGRTVKALVTELLSEGLGMIPPGQREKLPPSAVVEVGDRGLPVIRCHRRAPAARMSAEALLKLEQETQLEEDLQRAGITL